MKGKLISMGNLMDWERYIENAQIITKDATLYLLDILNTEELKGKEHIYILMDHITKVNLKIIYHKVMDNIIRLIRSAFDKAIMK